LALATESEDPHFAPEPFTKLYQRSLYQSMRGLKIKVFEQLKHALGGLPADAQDDARAVLGRGDEILTRFRAVLEHRIDGLRTRCPADYHLGQVLCVGKDFVIIDLEGDSARSIGERRLKRTPMRDAASMVRSFQYAAYSTLFGRQTGRGVAPGMIRPEDLPVL